jgi:hypothetical protein
MLTSAIVAYFHYFSFLLATAALMVETLTLKEKLERSEAWRIVIAVIDLAPQFRSGTPTIGVRLSELSFCLRFHSL